MGLAASQARFLAITARKADCEFRSMQIAQNKLSVTRELQAATEKWQNAMNAEMLVWDYDGTASDLQAVSYGLMTKPSVYNNFTPYLLTDRSGRVIVSQEIAAAAAAAGINPDKGGTRSEVNFNRFISALVGNDVISEQTANDMHNATFGPDAKYVGFDDKMYTCGSKDAIPVYVDARGNFLGTVLVNPPSEDINYNWQQYYNGNTNVAPEGSSIAFAISDEHKDLQDLYNIVSQVPTQSTPADIEKYWGVHIVQSNYNKDNGYGAEPMSKNVLTGMNLGQLIAAFKNKGIKNAFRDIDLKNLSLSDENSGGTQFNNLLQGDYGIEYKVKKDGTTYELNSFGNVSLSDILSGNVVLIGHHKDNDHEYHNDFNNFLKSYLKEAVCQIGIALGVFKEGIKNPDDTSNYIDLDYGQHFYTAYRFACSAFCEGATTVATKKNKDSKTEQAAISEAQASNFTVFYKNSGGSYNSTAAVSLSNMMDYFLTYVTILEDGFDSGYCAMDKVGRSAFVTNDPNYRWVVNAEETEINETVLKSDFYQQLFNNLCVNGYKTDQRVKNDNDYIEQMLKNGSYFVASLGDDGHFYQSRYNDAENTLIKVVADEDAIAVAESEYNYMKIKLTAKEDKLDLDMKNIDMEISALTTEYDSVKNLISKSIEKTFKQFEG